MKKKSNISLKNKQVTSNDSRTICAVSVNNPSYMLMQDARRKGMPFIIIDCQHIDRQKAVTLTQDDAFRRLIINNIDTAEKAGLCLGTILFKTK